MAEDVPVIVTVENPDRLDVVVAASKAHGMTNVSVLRSLGLLKGLANAAAIDAIAKIDGVRSVERERQIKVPDPRSRAQ
jgi:hypothetical protein